jgi:hypothetical protein
MTILHKEEGKEVVDILYTLINDVEARDADAVEKQLSEKLSASYFPWFD